MGTPIPTDLGQRSLSPPNGWGLLRTILISSVLVTLFLSAIYLAHTSIIKSLNLKATDIILRTAKIVDPELEVAIVAIDETSLKKYGQWPWPRNRVAQLLEIIKGAGGKSVGVNILFPERDRTSPKTLQKTQVSVFDYSVATPNISQERLDHDTVLANTLAKGPFVLGYEFLFNREGTTTSQCNLHPVPILYKGAEDLPSLQSDLYRAKGVICNYQLLANAVSASGFFNGTPDMDGILRRLPLLIEFDGKLYPSFGLAVLLKFYNNDSPALQADRGNINKLSLNGLHIPTDNLGNFVLGPARLEQTVHISAVDILEGKTSTDTLKDKIVLVGITAAGLTQVFQTPLTPITPLLDLHKHFIESLGSELHTVRTQLFPIYEAMASFLFSLLLAICIYYLPAIWSAGVCLLVASASWFVMGIVYQYSGYLFSPLLPTLVVIFNYGLLVPLKLRHFQQQAKSKTEDTLLLLKSSETNLESVLKTIPDIVFRLDDQDSITFISPAISKYVKPFNSLLGRPIFDLVAPVDIDKLQFHLNERKTGVRTAPDLEIRLLLAKVDNGPSETSRYFSVSAEIIYQTNTSQPQGFIGTQWIARDITERKRLENQLLQAQKMEVIGNLAAGIAHDLNNILSGLVSYPDLLLLEIPKDDPLHQKITVIQKSGRKAAVIVQDLLALARRNVAIHETCNLNIIISEYLTSIEFQHVKEKYPGITIHANLQESLLNIKGSTVHLSKIIMNVLHNALEAMVADGNITISTTNTYLDADFNGYENIPEGEYVCTSISDTGVGISEIDLQHIFEPFYSKKSMERSGTGLGMTIIWATIKDHDGYIDIKSNEGHGTTFMMYLPSSREKADTLQQLVTLDDYIGSETILVVDDIPQQLEIGRAILGKLGYDVLTAASGEAAIETIRKQPVDLVILDMIMPGGFDGLETYRAIQEIYPDQKAIITSGFSESERVKKLQKLGVGSYLQKPYTMENLGIVVRQELDRDKT